MRIKVVHTALVLAGVASLMLSACGGSSGGSGSSATTATFADITVERGPLLYALVSDADGNIAAHLGNGVYRFSDAPVHPISTVGGYIDVNRSGSVDAGDVRAGAMIMKSGAAGEAITLCSTLAGVPALRDRLLALGFTESQLLNATPSQDRMIAALSDELYKFAVSESLTDIATITTAQLENLTGRIQNRIAAYRVTTSNPAELELQLMNELANQVDILDDSDVSELANQDGNQLLVSGLPASVLSDDLKHTLSYMWNEEKLAKDVYFALNAIHPLNQLGNIASNSETQHQSLMEALLKKYNLSVWEPANPEAGFSSTALGSIAAGRYTDPSLQGLYEILYAKGAASSRDSLEVGCMVEVTDVNDLDRDIAFADSAPDVKAIFELLRTGSYRHYWAFDRGLKVTGVAEGCCSLGADYCHPEYPQSTSGMKRGQR